MRRAACLAVLALAAAGVAAAAAPAKKPPPIVIGVVLPSSGSYFAAIRKGVETSASAAGFHVRFSSTKKGGASKERAAIASLVADHVNALIVVPTSGAALTTSINSAVAAGIETATVALDVPGSRRAFFYGPSPAAEGRAQARHLLAALHAAKRHGEIGYLITSCFPGAVEQRGRRLGFEAGLAASPYKKEFTLKRLGFYGTTTVPFTNRLRIRGLLKKFPSVGAVYATCAPDTLNWGVTLRDGKKQGVLVAGFEWDPSIFALISQGWVTWSLGPSPYDMGLTASKLLFANESTGAALPKGIRPSVSIFATKANLDQIKAGPNYFPGG